MSLFLISDPSKLAISKDFAFYDGETGRPLRIVALDHNDESGRVSVYLRREPDEDESKRRE